MPEASQAPGSLLPAGWHTEEAAIEGVSFTISLPEGLSIEDGSIQQLALAVPTEVYDLEIEPWNERTVGHIAAWGNAEELEEMQNAGENGFDLLILEEMGHYRYTDSLEDYTYFYFDNFLVTVSPTLGISMAASQMEFIDFDTGLYFSFYFNPASVNANSNRAAFAYYSKIMETVSFQ